MAADEGSGPSRAAACASIAAVAIIGLVVAAVLLLFWIESQFTTF